MTNVAPDGASPKRWTALLLAGGYGKDSLRAYVVSVLDEMGFDTAVYDDPAYFVDSDVHSHQACLEAVAMHDVVVAVADESPGGTLAVSEISDALRRRLQELHILTPVGLPGAIPTIFQAEVLYARALGKPTVVMVSKSAAERADELAHSLTHGGIVLEPLHPAAPDPGPLVASKDWDSLSAHYRRSGGRITLRELAFLERMRKSKPNFITYFDPRDLAELKKKLRGRIRGTAVSWIRENSKIVTDAVETKRSPLGGMSLKQLLEEGMLIPPPFRVVSGDLEDGHLVSPGGRGALASGLASGRRILILGEPGLGKTTISLLAHKELLDGEEALNEGGAPLYEEWRGLPLEAPSLDGVVREVLGATHARVPWLPDLELPNFGWILTLDGLDEATIPRDALKALLPKLAEARALLVTCRVGEYERHFAATNDLFHAIVQLEPWGREEVLHYAGRLRALGKDQAAAYLETRLSAGDLPDFISFPLWVAMIAYLKEKAGRAIQAGSDYELLKTCMDAITEDEAERHHIRGREGELGSAWRQAAWAIHVARRRRQVLLTKTLFSDLGIQDEAGKGAVLSFVGTSSDEAVVTGFSHEVFQDYWLAEYIVDALTELTSAFSTIAEIFSYQRSLHANRLIRERLRARGGVEAVERNLRDAFWSLTDSPRDRFAKNQILYLVGRLDGDLAPTRAFLKTIWHSEEDRFVRYAAAFSAIQLGDMTIEQEYFTQLRSRPDEDDLNRGYHLYYYGDAEATEEEPIPVDDGSSSAEATLRNLFRRLARAEPRHRNVRRIEVLTIRRFLETGREVPQGVDANSVLTRLRLEASHSGDRTFGDSLRDEIDAVLELVERSR